MEEKNVMTVEEYLGQYLKIEDKIQSEKDYIASLRSIVENTTTHLSFTAGRNPSKDNGKFEDTMIDIVEAEQKYKEKLNRLGLKQQEVINFIRSIPKKAYQDVLRLRYVEGVPAGEIGDSLGKSRSAGYYLMNDALKAARKVFQK